MSIYGFAMHAIYLSYHFIFCDNYELHSSLLHIFLHIFRSLGQNIPLSDPSIVHLRLWYWRLVRDGVCTGIDKTFSRSDIQLCT
jgi:hypothetical protein